MKRFIQRFSFFLILSYVMSSLCFAGERELVIKKNFIVENHSYALTGNGEDLVIFDYTSKVFYRQKAVGAVNVEFVDFNYDGHLDIQVIYPTLPCGETEIILYQPKTQSFVKSTKQFNTIDFIKIKGKKLWYTYCASGCGSSSKVYSELFRIDNFEVRTIAKLYMHLDENYNDIDEIHVQKVNSSDKGLERFIYYWKALDLPRNDMGDYESVATKQVWDRLIKETYHGVE